MLKYIPRVVQTILSIPLIVFTCIQWHNNNLGQNIINLLAVSILLIGIDNIIIFYRCYIDQQSIQNQATFVIFSVYVLALLFQKFNKTHGHSYFNIICNSIVLFVLILNVLYFITLIITMIFYMVRQIYRLMTQTLLSANGNIQRSQLDLILNTRKAFIQAKRINSMINDSCSICLMEYSQTTMVVVLPGCQHCFHVECIQQWLTSKPTCPYCRGNIRLNLM